MNNSATPSGVHCQPFEGVKNLARYRMRDFRQAAVTSWETLRALGLGILVGFGCAMFATAVLAVSVATAW